MADSPFERFERLSLHHGPLGLSLDVSRMRFDEADLARLADAYAGAFTKMQALERGETANPDEGRMVGHYWLRAAELAPEASMAAAIEQAHRDAVALAADVHQGRLAPERGGRFEHALLVGIGGSALGPQLVHEALRSPADPLRLWFADNTDPDGFDRLLGELGDALARTLTIVVSKSGGTKETRNGMLEVEHAYRQRGLGFGRHAIAITQAGSQLDAHAEQAGFRARLPMWDWVGGRTSVTSAVGLVPAALGGVDTGALLGGAREMDALTRRTELRRNPAALLAASWQLAGEGQGKRAMVVLPYKDRLALFSRYLQQLVMESLGKREDLAGNVVHQGLTVYGNKGSTDQHAYVQQLLDGPDDAFVTFLEVRRDREGPSIEVEPGVTSGDYLAGFLQGTRRALAERGRRSLTIGLERLDARSLGALVALYERAVGLYAFVVGINAYHQPAVESGKRAAAAVLALQRSAVALLPGSEAEARTATELASALGSDDVEGIYFALRHLGANDRIGCRFDDDRPWDARFWRRTGGG